MKKIISIALLVALTISVSGCSVVDEIEKYTTEESEPKDIMESLYVSDYPVFLAFQYKKNLIFNKDKKINVYIDGKKIGKLKQGDSTSFGLILSSGKHLLTVSGGNFNSDSKILTVEKNKYLGADYPYYFAATLKFSDGKANIDDCIYTNYFDNADDELDYSLEILEIALDNFVSVDGFKEIWDKYYEQNPEKFDFNSEE